MRADSFQAVPKSLMHFPALCIVLFYFSTSKHARAEIKKTAGGRKFV
jgi:hypothetical protein